MQSHQEGWHLLLVRPGKEQAALIGFRRAKVRAYWPSYQPAARHAGSMREPARRSVIPGYLFVMGPADEAWWNVIERMEEIVTAAKTYGGGLVTLRQRDIDTIKKIEAGLDAPLPGKNMHQFKSGDRVRLRELDLPPGRVSKSTGDGRLVIDVELMGRVVPINVFPHQIEKG